MMPKRKVVVFDLDDTLFKEVDYLRSAFRAIADEIKVRFGIPHLYEEMLACWEDGQDVFGTLISKYHLPWTVDDLLQRYREHVPTLQLDAETTHLLETLRQSCVLGIITDGRSVTQRHKIASLGLEAFFEPDHMLISEETGTPKLSPESFVWFMDRYPDHLYYYIGDNPQKDFVCPNRLGWQTICLKNDGRNIHPQDFSLAEAYLPGRVFQRMRDIEQFLMA